MARLFLLVVVTRNQKDHIIKIRKKNKRDFYFIESIIEFEKGLKLIRPIFCSQINGISFTR